MKAGYINLLIISGLVIGLSACEQMIKNMLEYEDATECANEKGEDQMVVKYPYDNVDRAYIDAFHNTLSEPILKISDNTYHACVGTEMTIYCKIQVDREWIEKGGYENSINALHEIRYPGSLESYRIGDLEKTYDSLYMYLIKTISFTVPANNKDPEFYCEVICDLSIRGPTGISIEEFLENVYEMRLEIDYYY